MFVYCDRRMAEGRKPDDANCVNKMLNLLMLELETEPSVSHV